MGSIDIPPFLREKMKDNIKATNGGEELPLPDFIKKKEKVGGEDSFNLQSMSRMAGMGQSIIPEVSKKPNATNREYTVTDAIEGYGDRKPTKLAKTTAGIYNTLVGSVARLAGGISEIGQDFEQKVHLQTEKDEVIPRGKWRKESVEQVEQLRSPVSTKEEEAKMRQFDVTDGVSSDDVKALLFQAPSTILDMAAGALTYGTSFGVQAINDAAEELDNSPNAQNLSDSQRMGYVYTNGLIQGALERLGVNKIIKNTGASKFIQKKLASEITEELVAKGGKATADQIEREVIKRVGSLSNQLKTKGVGVLKSIGWEGGTEGTQQVLSDLSRITTNRLSGSEIFDEQDITENFLKNTINATVQGGAMGGLFSGGHMVLSSNAESIKGQINNAQTQEQIEEIKKQNKRGSRKRQHSQKGRNFSPKRK